MIVHCSGVVAGSDVQCEAPDLLNRWCEAKGVTHIEGSDAPLVFFKGFTRSFIDGQQGTSGQWLATIAEAVDSIAENKAVVIVDGVGFPGVGSCVGASNAEVLFFSSLDECARKGSLIRYSRISIP